MQTYNYHHIKEHINKNSHKISSLSFIFEEIAKRMSERLDYIKINPLTILDIGSGLNIDTASLHHKFPKATIYNLDISLKMLRQNQTTKNWYKKLFSKTQFIKICANALELPLQTHSIDMIWSNLMLPYISEPEIYFKEVRRILKLNGVFLVTGFGVDSLKELRLMGLRTFNFPDMHIIGDMLVKLGFSNPVTDTDYLTIEYDSPEQLLNDIRLVGCGSALSINKNLTKREYNELLNNLTQKASNSKTPLTLEIFYAHAWKDKPLPELEDRKIIQFFPKV